jgi:hypothetical protein
MNKRMLLVLSALLMLSAVTSLSFAQIPSQGRTAKSFVVSNIPPHPYTGEPVMPSITIREGRDLLQRDVDYTVEYRNNINAGTAIVVIKGVEGGNYSESITKEFQIEKAKLAVLIDDELGKPYGQTDPPLTYRIRSGELMGKDTFNGELVREPGETIGNYRIEQGTLSAGPNYDLSVIGSSYFSIFTAPITIRAAATQKKTYGALDPSLRYSIVEGTMLKDDKLTGELTRMPGEDVGKYAITQGTLSANENYEIRFIRDYLEILPAPVTVKADASRKMYNEQDSALTYSITAGKLMNGEQLRGQLTRDPGEDIGKYNIKQGSLTAGDNYVLTFIPAVFEITQKPLSNRP